MKSIWAEILVPAAIVGLTLAQTVGVETTRAVRLSSWFPVPQQDTVVQADTVVLRDTLRSPLDSLADEEDFDLFALEEQDTTPKIYARDTMKVPDSLRFTDPFLYRWYVAVKDSYTHRIVVDSLKAEGDSTDWPVIDSLFLADSTAAAIERHNRWYAGLSKAERKRYDYEQKLPAILHRQDSILARKDSLKRIKDSIIQNTPRILETAFLPDSMYYKRLVTWRHERHFNGVETFEWDTTANYHFYDYPFMRKDVGATWLGMPGSAVQSYNFFAREDKDETVSFFAPYETWTYTPSTLPMFNTKTPYTELEYYGNLLTTSTKSADNIRIFTTQNITPALNLSVDLRRFGGAGTLQNEHTDNRSVYVAGNYLGKKYLAHGGLIHNTMTRVESGGMQDNTWIRDTTVDVREIAVNLANATNHIKKNTLFFDQTYRIPLDFIERLKHRGDTSWTKKDTLDTDQTTAFIGSSSEYSVYTKQYVDKTDADLSAFFNGVFNMNPAKSADSMRIARLDNRIFVRLQPWHEDAVVSKVEGGAGFRHQSHYLLPDGGYIRKAEHVNWNTAYAYAGAEGRLRQYVAWDILARYNFAGAERNDLLVKADASLNLFPFRRQPHSPVSLGAHFETALREPGFYEQHLHANHYSWDNDFSKISTTQIRASLDIPKWQLHASVGYALLANHVYYDTLGIVRQNTEPMSVLSAALNKNLVLGPLHLDNRILFQYSSDQEVLPLPTLALNLRWYIQFPVVRDDVMRMQIGVDARYTTLWYAPTYNLVTGTFAAQNEYRYGNCPVFDPFVNIQWKKACIFLKMENVGNGWPMSRHDYFTAHHYIQTPRIFKFGISWPFYPSLKQNKTLSSRAGEALGGGGGSSRGGSGLSGATSSLKNGLNSRRN